MYSNSDISEQANECSATEAERTHSIEHLVCRVLCVSLSFSLPTHSLPLYRLSLPRLGALTRISNMNKFE